MRHACLFASAIVLLFAIACGGGSAPTSASRQVASPAIAVAQIPASALFGASAVDFARCLQGAADAACLSGARLTLHAVSGAAATAPGAPGNLVSSSSGSAVTLTWSAPSSGDPVTSYLIEAGSGSGLANLANVATGSTATAFFANGVGNGTYYVRVRAQNAGGTSAASNESILVVGGGRCTGPPSPPAALRFTRVGTQLVMEWNPAAGASEYVIEAGSVTNGNDIYVGSAGLNTTFTAIIPEATHAFVRVYARNACGKSLRGDEIEIGALWTVSFTRQAGLNANACVPAIANGGLCSQVLVLRSFGQFEEIWSPMTPVMRVRGAMTPTQFTATVECVNGAASGTLTATWNGERYVGTGTLGGSVTAMRVTPGSYDPQCLAP